MITTIKVNGFRSLYDFSLRIKPGLNVLVGPNGSGKTNIILFFEFLSRIMNTSLSEAVSSCGGAGAIFQKYNLDELTDSFSAVISGKKKIDSDSGTRDCKYQYSFTVSLSENRDEIYFKEQRFLIKNKKPHQNEYTLDLDISMLTSENQRTTKTTIHKIDFRKYDLRRDYFDEDDLHIDTPPSQRAIRKEKISSLENQLGNRYSPEYNVLLSLSSLSYDLRTILLDLIGGEAFNVMPSAAKEPEDSTTPAGIRKDGSGLASTLYALKKAQNEDKLSGARRRGVLLSPAYGIPFRVLPRSKQRIRISRMMFKEIQELTSVVNEQIQSLDVKLDHTDNKFHISVNLVGEDESIITLPFSAMSDGTVKWVALVTAILTNPSIFAIEEPENFIHPLMQKEIVSIMRNAHRNNNHFVIMSTHSETLLNAADPTEVIVVSMHYGRTKAKRPRAIESIRKEIEDTGFGLGHFYLTGVLSDD